MLRRPLEIRKLLRPYMQDAANFPWSYGIKISGKPIYNGQKIFIIPDSFCTHPSTGKLAIELTPNDANTRPLEISAFMPLIRKVIGDEYFYMFWRPLEIKGDVTLKRLKSLWHDIMLDDTGETPRVWVIIHKEKITE